MAELIRHGLPELSAGDWNGDGWVDETDMGAFLEQNQTPPRFPGDLNCDGSVNSGDIRPFVTALVSRKTYEAMSPACNWLNGDINNDGLINFNDVDPFVTLLLAQPTCP